LVAYWHWGGRAEWEAQYWAACVRLAVGAATREISYAEWDEGLELVRGLVEKSVPWRGAADVLKSWLAKRGLMMCGPLYSRQAVECWVRVIRDAVGKRRRGSMEVWVRFLAERVEILDGTVVDPRNVGIDDPFDLLASGEWLRDGLVRGGMLGHGWQVRGLVMQGEDFFRVEGERRVGDPPEEWEGDEEADKDLELAERIEQVLGL